MAQNPRVKAFVDEVLPELNLSDLEFVESHVQLLIKIHRQNLLSIDLDSDEGEQGGAPTLATQARDVLMEGNSNYKFTLADQALLAAVIQKFDYGREVFSSRDINKRIEECGRPRIAHITSAVNGLIGKGYLAGTTKEATLTREGLTRAPRLIETVHRFEDAA